MSDKGAKMGCCCSKSKSGKHGISAEVNYKTISRARVVCLG